MKKEKRIKKINYDVRVHLTKGDKVYLLRFWNRKTKKYITDLETRFKANSLNEALVRRDNEQANEKFINYIERQNTATDFLAFYEDLIAGKRNVGTIRYYMQSLAMFKEFVGSALPFTAITKELIENFKSFLLRKVKQNTANGYFAAFAHVLRSAEEQGRLQHLFFKRIPQEQVEKDYLTKQEISKIIKTPWENRLKQAFILECLGAFAFNELKRLQWKNINYDDSSITSKRQKTGEIISNPINKEILLMLGHKGKPADLVFPELTTLKRYNNNIKGLVSAAGIDKHITSHCGRGSCIIHLIGSRGGTYSAQSFAGHRDMKTTLRYAKYTPELKKQAGEDLMQGIELPKTD